MAKLTVRLPKTELIRIKSVAAAGGLTLQAAVREALEAWASRPTLCVRDFERQMKLAEEILHDDHDVLTALSR